MPTLNEISVSYAMLLGLNGLAVITLWVEYSATRHTFIKFACLGQLSSLIWHLMNIALIATENSNFVFTLSSSFLALTVIWFFAATANHPRLTTTTLTYGSLAYLALLWLDYWLQLGAITPMRFAIMLLFYAMPLAAMLRIKGTFRVLIATLQLFSAITLYSGLSMIYGDQGELGALLYLLTGMLIPILSICFVMLSTNLSRKQAEDSERKYRVFFEAVDDVFFETDEDLRVINISPSISQFDVDSDVILGRRISEYLKDDTEFDDLSQESLKSGEAFSFSGLFKSRSGPVDCEITCTPMRSSTNKMQFAGIIRNTLERNLLERQFINAQRHESLGKLAGGIAHDFNNLLQGIMGHAELMRKKGLAVEQQQASMEAIVKGAASAGALCRQLLLYTGTNTNLKEDLELCELVNEVSDILRPSLGGRGEMEVVRENCPVCVRGDKAQIGQVVMNLVKNAIEASDKLLSVKILLERESIDDPRQIESQIGVALKKGKYARLTVQDNGVGIAPTLISRIFDPFFTTKEKGHGLGLAAIVGILTAHDGTITVQSEPGNGTQFTVWLPLIENPNIQKPISAIDSSTALSVLLVDDEEDLLGVGKSLLEEMGHKVVTADSGALALEILAGETFRPDLLLSDIKMPEMDGIELMRKVFESYPDIAVILASGYADITNALSAEESKKIDFLCKPYHYQELLRAIESARLKSPRLSSGERTPI